MASICWCISYYDAGDSYYCLYHASNNGNVYDNNKGNNHSGIGDKR